MDTDLPASGNWSQFKLPKLSLQKATVFILPLLLYVQVLIYTSKISFLLLLPAFLSIIHDDRDGGTHHQSKQVMSRRVRAASQRLLGSFKKHQWHPLRGIAVFPALGMDQQADIHC